MQLPKVRSRLIRAIAVVAVILAAGVVPQSAAAQGLVNGSFETQFQGWLHGINPNQVFRLPTGYYAGSVAQDGFYYEALQGHGELYQDVSGFTIGQQYSLSFFLAPWFRYQMDANGNIIFPNVWEQGSTVDVVLADANNLSNSITQNFSTPYLYAATHDAQGNSLYPYNPYDTWYQQTYLFTAFATSMRVSFIDPDPVFVGYAGSLGNNPGLDNVSLQVVNTPVTATPEPATVTLMGLGLGAVARARRRKAASA